MPCENGDSGVHTLCTSFSPRIAVIWVMRPSSHGLIPAVWEKLQEAGNHERDLHPFQT